jgi:hypothetical protein
MMYQTAMTAVEQSAGSNGEAMWCCFSDSNIEQLRGWAKDASRTHGGAYGESHTAQGMVFRGVDFDVHGDECDWCVIVEEVANDE